MFRKFYSSDLFRAIALMKHRLWPYLLSLVIGRLSNAFFFNAIQAFIFKDVIDAAVESEPSLLQRALVFASVAFFAGVPLIVVFYYFANRYVKQTMADIRVKLFRHTSDLPIHYFEQHHSGDLISRLMNDLETMEGVFNSIRDLTRLFTFGIVSLGSILILDWRFVFLVLLLGLLTVSVNTVFAKPLRQVSDLIQQHWGALTERLMDLLQSLPETKMFHLESVIHETYTQQNERMAAMIVKRGRITALHKMLDFLLGNIRSIGLLTVGLYMHLQGYGIEISTVVAIVYLQGNADIMFSGLGNVLTGMQRSLAGAGRLLALLDIPIESTDHTKSESLETAGAEANSAMIALKNVTFGYEKNLTPENTVLHDLSLSVSPGQMVALVGVSGSGKSTILKLLLGFYPLPVGEIVINGRPANAYPLSKLREMMAYVSQDAYLFDGTIEENIRYGKPEATRAEIIAAAKVAHAHNFILTQPKGYETLVGERGAKLSGGQRQRIAIARALLKDAPILLLDEATSALDSESERLVQEALSRLMQGCTTIAIAHRLSTVEHANVIYVINNGKIIEQGQHQELAQKESTYKRLYEAQFRK